MNARRARASLLRLTLPTLLSLASTKPLVAQRMEDALVLPKRVAMVGAFYTGDGERGTSAK